MAELARVFITMLASGVFFFAARRFGWGKALGGLLLFLTALLLLNIWIAGQVHNMMWR